eukprot:gnl/TRDRNA2_/TRDRNA2_73801_c0_seq1.p1 gnl/TRDRNA2_/TRDRNA2_73801_c0~~gnl/TRDRNA2_/TRDRNA2_73801_c0_seq1.p1  ORF type:complete len:103 (-),score=15.21 gnl/TRDRNA2_/TRDRNA2_73801_c0_seq1:308-616(-)
MPSVNSNRSFKAQTSIIRLDWTMDFKQAQVEEIDQPMWRYDKVKQIYLPRLDARRGQCQSSPRQPVEAESTSRSAAKPSASGRCGRVARSANDVLALTKVPL